MKRKILIIPIILLFAINVYAGSFGGSSRKSKQEFTITILNGATSGTATITAVDTDNYDLTLLGHTVADAGDYAKPVRIKLTNSTTVTAYIGTAAALGGDATIEGEIVDYYGSVD